MANIEEGIDILIKLGLPRLQQNERSALTLLAVLDLKPNAQWSKAKKRIIRIHDIISFVENVYKKQYAENSRESIRRSTIHQFEQAGVLVKNPDNPTRPTNSPNTVYSISDEALKVIIKYKTKYWDKALHEFISDKGRLIEKYDKRKKKKYLPLVLPGGKAIDLSPGKHNELQIKIVYELMPRFCSGSEVVYVGDTAKKLLHIDEQLLKKLKIPITQHEKLPDVVLYDKKKNHLLLIEAVTSHGPISPKRQIELEKTLKDCKATRIYISAFPDFREFKKHTENIAWDTEVWIAENPDHMIHFNGPQFFTAY